MYKRRYEKVESSNTEIRHQPLIYKKPGVEEPEPEVKKEAVVEKKVDSRPAAYASKK
jgi:hypothetical protein